MSSKLILPGILGSPGIGAERRKGIQPLLNDISLVVEIGKHSLRLSLNASADAIQH